MAQGTYGHRADCVVLSYNAAEMGTSAAIEEKAARSQERTFAVENIRRKADTVPPFIDGMPDDRVN